MNKSWRAKLSALLAKLAKFAAPPKTAGNDCRNDLEEI